MKTKIGIFNGKEAKNNEYLLLTLYNKGPLSTWELARTVRKTNLRSLNAIFNRRLKALEKKDYVERAKNHKWVLKFKGIIACLIIQEEPKAWNEKWSMLFERFVQPVIDSPKNYLIMADGKEICGLKDYLEKLLKTLKSFESWALLSKKLNEFMENGFMKNLDVISAEEMFLLIVTKVLFEKEYFQDYTQ